jgi:hypothetical protein
VITSYHGMPRSYLERGDPYHCQCVKTTRLVREHLGWPEEKLIPRRKILPYCVLDVGDRLVLRVDAHGERDRAPRAVGLKSVGTRMCDAESDITAGPL